MRLAFIGHPLPEPLRSELYAQLGAFGYRMEEWGEMPPDEAVGNILAGRTIVVWSVGVDLPGDEPLRALHRVMYDAGGNGDRAVGVCLLHDLEPPEIEAVRSRLGDPVRAVRSGSADALIDAILRLHDAMVTPDEPRHAPLLPMPEDVLAQSYPYLSPVIYSYQRPPADDPFPYPEHVADARGGVETASGRWIMAAASRRGGGHAHDGTHRDDAFALGRSGDWHLLAVADGAGSAAYSRKTANDSVRIAIDALSAYGIHPPVNQEEARQRMVTALEAAVMAIHQAQEAFTLAHNLSPRDVYTTLMLLIQQPFADGSSVIGTFQVGDGVMVALHATDVIPLQTPDVGAYPGETRFVLSYTVDQLVLRVQVESFAAAPACLVMTDGLSETVDDVLVFGRDLLRRHLTWPRWEQWGEILAAVLNDDHDSLTDDRTLAVLVARDG